MFKDSFFEKLKELSAIQGLAGQEQLVVKRLVELMKPLADELEVDHMGNIYAYLKGNKPGPTIMVSSHSDEIGCIIRDIDDRGFIGVEKLGGVSEQMLPARKVIVNGHLGVVGTKPGNFQYGGDGTKGADIKDLFIDVGAKSREEVHEMGIQIGDPVTYYSELERFTNNDLIVGKAIDNRSCCALLVELLIALKDRNFSGTLVAVATVQEEVGLRGAKVAAYKISPDFAIIIDTIPINDTPHGRGYPLKIGSGPVLAVMQGDRTRGIVMTKKMKDLVLRYSRELDSPVQLSAMAGGTCEIAAVHLEREGILSASLSFPRRYAHTPVEMADLNDYETGLKLLEGMLRDVDNWGDMSFI